MGIALGTAIAFACAGYEPTAPRDVSKTEFYHYDYAPGDSSPDACAQMDCVSISQAERDELLFWAEMALTNAAYSADAECFTLFVSMHGKVSSNKLFKMQANVIMNGQPVRGAYNHGHGDMYVRWDLFASLPDLLNTTSHETAHGLGYKDDAAPFAEDVAVGCARHIW